MKHSVLKKTGIFLSFMLAASNAWSAEHRITVTNTTSLERKDEQVVLTRTAIEKEIGQIPDGQFVTLYNGANPVAVQFDDMDGDQRWDEVVFLYSFAPHEQLVLKPTITQHPNLAKKQRAYVRQKHKNADDSFGAIVTTDTMPYQNSPTDFTVQALPPYLTEGPAWENDKVGFRIYFDTRNTKDIWGKTTDKMVLDFVGVDPKVIYHHLDWWGMDIFKVGSSLGAGSLALHIKLPDGKDSRVRLGEKNIDQVTYRQISAGPLRAVFELQYKGWKVAENLPKVDLKEQISIWGGHYFYESKVQLDKCPSGSALVTGYANFLSAGDHTYGSADGSALYTDDLQSENQDGLGLGIITQKARNVVMGRTRNDLTDVQNTSFVQIPAKPHKPIVFRFVSGWQKSDPMFETKKGFADYVKTETQLFAAPLQIFY